jgi:hypothetical protein
MMDFFRAHRANGTTIPTYFIESTAPDNVDDTVPEPSGPLDGLAPINSDDAITEIAKALANGRNPNLVVMVHGFNNPEPAVLRTYTAAAMAIEGDEAIKNRQGLVCVGYRWPSEKMGQPRRGTWDAMPTLPTWIFNFGLIVLGLTFLVFWWGLEANRWSFWHVFGYVWDPGGFHLVILVGWTVAGLILTAALLRTIVYFRDNYRATNYGVPDLIQIIRAIDAEILKQCDAANADRREVQLSFIGHSMGGFVVTNTIRTLSNLFAAPVPALSSYGVRASPDSRPESTRSRIGNVFSLKRFVLASPDIPAETLLSSRGNFLASALKRFDEAYLFSNEGDEVLRQISTLANYFVFPTKTRNHGFRLGNVEILSRNFGLMDVKEDDFLRVLRIGNSTLQELYDALEDAKAKRHENAPPPLPPSSAVAVAPEAPPEQASLPKVFTYFDCTDYVDLNTEGGKARPLLTFAKWRKRNDPKAKLRWYSHFHLLLAYLFCGQRPNVHGGYFEGRLSQQLIYRLACLGYEDTVTAYGGEGPLSQACEDKQIRGLLSPNLVAGRSWMPPPVPPLARSAAQAKSPPAPAAAVELPDLVGTTIVEARQAVAAISRAGRGSDPKLLLLEITKESRDKPPGTVISQTPAPGRVPQDTTVEVVVAK